MKGKALLCLAIALSMAFAAMPAAKAPATALAFIFEETNTPELVGPPPYVCENFTLWLKVFEISALWYWSVKVNWDPTVLTCLEVMEGHFLKDVGGTLFPTPPIDNEKGEIPALCCGLMVPEGATGSGILAILKFHVESFTKLEGTYINVTVDKFLDPAEVPIPIDVVTQGWLQLLPPGPTPPNAEFVPVDSTFIFVGDNVSLSAVASEPGWDSLPSPEGNTCPITDYTWYIDIGCDDTIDLTLEGITAKFLCEATGDVRINLTVYAPDPVPPTDERYVPYDSEAHVIHQIVKPVGPSIDVYTEKGGKGPGINPETGYPFEPPTAWSDAFGPQEEVTVYAYVTYNDEPVEYTPVAFEVKDPNGTTRVTRTAFTDASGIAVTEFRIPWEGSGAEATFGDWQIWGIVDVSEIAVEDLCQFRFGYIVSTRDIIVTTPRPEGVKKCESIGVQVDIKSISFTSKDVYLAIVLYDECGVPIGIATADITVDPEDGLTSTYTIHIPTWAFVGTGTIYVNIFSEKPIALGTPMCPERSATFTILKSADP